MRSITDPTPHQRLFLSPSCAASHDSSGWFWVASGGLMGQRKTNMTAIIIILAAILWPRALPHRVTSSWRQPPDESLHNWTTVSSRRSDFTLWPVMTVINWSRGDSATVALCTVLLASKYSIQYAVITPVVRVGSPFTYFMFSKTVVVYPYICIDASGPQTKIKFGPLN